MIKSQRPLAFLFRYLSDTVETYFTKHILSYVKAYNILIKNKNYVHFIELTKCLYQYLTQVQKQYKTNMAAVNEVFKKTDFFVVNCFVLVNSFTDDTFYHKNKYHVNTSIKTIFLSHFPEFCPRLMNKSFAKQSF